MCLPESETEKLRLDPDALLERPAQVQDRLYRPRNGTGSSRLSQRFRRVEHRLIYF